ncbi:probable carbohydrate esterase At4g34215 [Juglans microcarpa x Juglans regia]|uniref:probable carbohydrate esterase At4g34215 n=1 Tax=Juglans microcarpa x Juglans regia TaxID=2249226 RepID=UPI001B7DF50D|nr:probable carbohydrate esterase At4g34215 [Juglans microcarpa x Juglans regia]
MTFHLCRTAPQRDMVPLLFFSVLVAQAWSVRPQQLPVPKNIFILAGQSNMAGRGGVVNDTITGVATWDGIIPPQCQPNPSVLRLSANLTWVLAHEPLHADIDVNKTNGVGPGMAFANVLAKDPTFGAIGLVPCAIGGTKISEWARGTFLYNQLVQRARASLIDGRGSTIQALLWYQGESDTIGKEDAESYKGKLERFFMDLRDDLQSPLLPIIQVGLASGAGPFIKIVREEQMGIDLLNLRTVDAKGLALEPDGLHLTSPSQVRLGQMLADTFLQFLPSGPIVSLTYSGSSARCSTFIVDFFIAPLLRCINRIILLN